LTYFQGEIENLNFGEFMSIEIELRLSCDSYDNGQKIIEALEGEIATQRYGVDSYIDLERSKENGRLMRVRNHIVQKDGEIYPYKVIQIKTYIPFPQDSYGVECWDESEPKHINPLILGRVESQGHSISRIECYRRSFYVPFEEELVELNGDIIFQQSNHLFLPIAFYLEIGKVVNSRQDIPETRDFLHRFLDRKALSIMSHMGITPMYGSIYPFNPLLVSNRRQF